MTSQVESHDYAVETKNIFKSYGSVHALKGVSIAAKAGEVTSIIGDNGAGKSTLIKIIAGVEKADEGTVEIFGEPVSFHSPEAAREAGIETVYQTLGLIEDLTIWQNLFLKRELMIGVPPFRILNKRVMRNEAVRMLSELDVHIPSVKARVRGLSGGQRQAVAISRAAGWSSQVVIMDEPTAALGVRETAKVEELIERLKARGLAVIVISHNFDQVLRLSEQIWVMRQGNVITGMRASDTSGDELVSLITGATQARQ
ncbi:MAG: ATP-binding cassette domain-containing protein [Candidatus Nanopelagicales bacterium]|jgi:simple sugar transport system ATP-binding protein